MRVFLRACGICVSLGLVLLGLMGSSCDDDPPNGPGDPEPIDYPLYFGDQFGEFFTFHPLTQQLDSATVPYDMVRGITISPDGDLLYLTGQYEVTVITADSRTLVTSFPQRSLGPVACSPDGRYIAASGLGTQIRRTSDYSVIFTDSAKAFGLMCFSAGSNALYLTVEAPDRYPEAARIDLTTNPPTMTRKRFSHGAPQEIIPNEDETRWYMYSVLIGGSRAFEIYDVASDSIIVRDPFVPGAGHLAITPDYRYAIYTTPGRDATSCPPEFYLRIYDLEANAVHKTITDPAYFIDSNWIAWPNDLAVTADSRWLGILGGGAIHRGLFYLYDLESDSFVYRAPWDMRERIFAPGISTPRQP